MTYRVIQWGTGNTGKPAVQGIIDHPELELVGCWVHSEAKDGLDVGEICGIGPVGVKATRDKDALIAMDADCVSFMPARTWAGDSDPTFKDLLAILRSGKNVANLWWPALMNARAVGEEAYQQLQDACREGKSSIYTAGMNPGFGTIGLALFAYNLSSTVETISCNEFYNYSYWAEPAVNIFFGFGRADPAEIRILQPGVSTEMFGSTIDLLAETLGVRIDDIIEDHKVLFAEKMFEIAAGPIEKGTVAGLACKITGMSGGKPRVIINHTARLREEDFGEEAFRGNGYRVDIDGDPVMRVDIQIASPKGTSHDHGLAMATSMSVINAIPEICAAAPGPLRILDLTMTSRRF